MENTWKKNLVITSGRANQKLAQEIADYCGVKFTELEFTNFSDGDWKPKFPHTIRRETVVIVQPTNPTLEKGMGENLYELIVIADAAKRASAKEIIAVIPYFGGARQDRKDEPRVPITAKVNARMIEAAGISKVIAMDLHVDQIQGFFDIPVDHLFASRFFAPQIQKLDLPNLAVSSADVGGARRAESYAKYLNAPLIICYKSKFKGQIEKITPLRDVEDKNIVMLDDIIDSAKTITGAANILLEKGAASVTCFGSHGVMSGDAYEKIEKSGIAKFYLLDSIQPRKISPKIEIISSAPLFGDALKEHMTAGGSISKLFLWS
ncbi:MAG: ribose-phosphate diphosphokinase [bacterium]